MPRTLKRTRATSYADALEKLMAAQEDLKHIDLRTVSDGLVREGLKEARESIATAIGEVSYALSNDVPVAKAG